MLLKSTTISTVSSGSSSKVVLTASGHYTISLVTPKEELSEGGHVHKLQIDDWRYGCWCRGRRAKGRRTQPWGSPVQLSQLHILLPASISDPPAGAVSCIQQGELVLQLS